MAVLSVLRKCGRLVMGAVAATVMFASSPVVLILHTGWRVFSIVLPRRFYYYGDDFLWGSYQKLVVFCFEHLTGVTINIHGEIPAEKENNIFICNHQCTMDWIITDILAARQGMIGNLRYVFKNAIKYLPLYGYVFGVHGGVFVKRDGSYNERNMKRVLQRLTDCKVDMYFVVFPEGTRFSLKRKGLLAKSQAYAIENDLRPLTQVLTPRVKAFHCALTSMKSYVKAVYDVTIIYESADHPKEAGKRSPAPNMWQFLVSDRPSLHLYFERIPIQSVASSSQRATMRWLHNRFALKDAIVCRHFGIEPQFESKSNIAGVVTQTKAEFRDPKFPEPKVSRLPLSATLPHAAFYTAALSGMLWHPEGRQCYLGTLFGGGLLAGCYAKLFL